jgi:hypothetical protein
MSHPLGPASDRSYPGKDLVDELSRLLSTRDSSPEKTAKVQHLFDDLVKEITSERFPSEKLLARVEVLILPMMGMSFEEPINAKIRTLSHLVASKAPATTFSTLDKERLKAKIENCSMFSDQYNRLLETAKAYFLTGGLKDKDDIWVIERLFVNHANIFTPFESFLKNLSYETAPFALSYLIENYPGDFLNNIFFICDNLSSRSFLNELEIVDLLSRKEDFERFIPIIVSKLHSQDEPPKFHSERIAGLLFNAFVMNERTSELFTQEVMKQLDEIINSKKSISPHQMNFIIEAFDLISDKTEAVAKLETWKAIYPKISLVAGFNELEKALKAEKLRELEHDPVKKDIDQHTGELWRCIGRREGPTGIGFLYKFKIKPEYLTSERLTTAKMREIYPAIEFTFDQSFRLIDTYYHTYLADLGYSNQPFDDHNVITLPDRDALIALYNRYRESHPDLPELNIISSPGIATDKDFVQAMIKHDAMVADGKEFIHDHSAHILVLLKRIFEIQYDSHFRRSDFNLFKTESTKHYQMYLDKVERLKSELSKGKSDFFTEAQARDLSTYFPVFETLVGALVDTLSNRTTFDPYTLENGIIEPQWQDYLKKRYSQASHDASPEPKPPIVDDTTIPQIRALLPLIEGLPVSPDH